MNKNIKISTAVPVNGINYFLVTNGKIYMLVCAADLQIHIEEGNEIIGKLDNKTTISEAINDYTQCMAEWEQPLLQKKFSAWKKWSNDHIFRYSLDEIKKIIHKFVSSRVLTGGEICDYCGDCEECCTDTRFESRTAHSPY